ncbi:MAG: Re/Si-specific NAD(P)(+) transhydrogenase subunit alpha [Pseudomonadota bacterium]
MQIAIPKEIHQDETRVAATPEAVKKYIALGFDVVVQSGAGGAAAYTDEAFRQAGAKLAKSAKETVKNADIVLKLRAPAVSEIADYSKGTILVCLMEPHNNGDIMAALAKQGVKAFGMELVPRITRAQSMDVLSSQSNLAGYKAVLDAAAEFGRAFPLMMTAAGTIPPAKVFVMGAGVAGLQAIATAKRLGAVVSATDVRAAAREQVESLGGSFVMVEDEEVKQAETTGGYAKEMSKDYQKKQAALIAETIAKQDVVITTALIPGRTAPVLVTAEMVKTMKPGAVVVDLAVEQGGNCELSEAGKIVDVDGVKIIGHRNVPGRVAVDASALYARNLFNFVQLLLAEDKKSLISNFEDEILQASLLTNNGKLVHKDFGSTGTKKPAAKKKTATKKTTAKKAAPKKGTAAKKSTAAKKAPSRKTAGTTRKPEDKESKS